MAKFSIRFIREKGTPASDLHQAAPFDHSREFAGGLRELLQARSSMEVPVGDAGILRDLDTEEDYQKALPPELPLSNRGAM